MIRMIQTFAADREGATAIEYGLIAAFVCMVVIGAIGAVGDQTGALLMRLLEEWQAASAS
ncbi:MAG: Flp family type IVb pilin [Caulobacterales bacterium]